MKKQKESYLNRAKKELDKPNKVLNQTIRKYKTQTKLIKAV